MPEPVVVKKPMIHILSVRIESEDMRKLRHAARVHGVGVTTMARILLRQALAKAEAPR